MIVNPLKRAIHFFSSVKVSSTLRFRLPLLHSLLLLLLPQSSAFYYRFHLKIFFHHYSKIQKNLLQQEQLLSEKSPGSKQGHSY
ncbi:wsv462 [White spot syndrome virus]|uniref:Wsv462 n=1 Tax=White spot syndrome virus (isolate Shrimp/China/Tongan/1996) TaxID=654913 RepID=Q8VAF8_WSSVS|nr:wsv462 [Shrimp white spot syndrome virus]AAL33463.1 wsv462 [Shrimp white spot syndrome virus]